jgi:hypothetical protein
MSEAAGRDGNTQAGESTTPAGESTARAGEKATPEGESAPPAREITTQAREVTTQLGEIKRTSGPHTTNGRRWEVQLSGIPPAEWLELFKVSGDSSARALPQRVEFDRATAAFKSEEDQVAHWIQSIDRWIASTNSRYLTALERARRERTDRLHGATKEKERIQQLNDRFKDL